MTDRQWGYIDENGKFAIAPGLYQAAAFEGEVARVRRFGDARWGLVGRTGEVVLPPTYDHIKDFREGAAAVNQGGKLEDPRQDPALGVVRGGTWGLVDSAGRELVAPTLDFADGFSEGLAAATKDGKCGFLDHEGRWAVEPRWSFTGHFSEGLAVASDGKQDGFVGPDGAVVIEPAFAEAAAFVGGLARVRTAEGKWHYVDRAGKRASDDFDEIGPHVDGLARVRRGAEWAIVDAKGRLVGGQWFDEAAVPAGGVAAVRRGDRWSFLAADGSLRGSFVRALAHSEGLARVSDGKAWGLADASAALVVPHRYDDLWAMHQGRAAALRDEHWTYVDREAREIVEPVFDEARPFAEGRAAVMRDGRWGFVDTVGTVLDLGLAAVGWFAGGLCAAKPAPQPVRIPTHPASCHVLPAKGLEDRVFEGTDAEDHLILLVGFTAELDDALFTRTQHVLYSWEEAARRIKPGSIFTENSHWLSRHNMRVRVENLRDPRGEVAALVGELQAAEIPMSEVIYYRWRMQPEGVMGAVRHPDDRQGNAWFDDFEAYWKEVWDRNVDPPASESPMHLKGALPGGGGPIGALEERPTPLFVPGLRICYGVAPHDGLETDARTEAVALAVTEVLRDRFVRVWRKPVPAAAPASGGWAKEPSGGFGKPAGGGWAKQSSGALGKPATERPVYPEPRSRKWERGQVERIQHGGRTGYAFALDCAELLHDASPSRFRYREQETMEALAAAIEKLDLESVVLWQRFGDPIFGPLTRPTNYVVHLWEHSRSSPEAERPR